MKRNKEKERERYLIDRVASHQSRKRESSNQLVASMNEDLFDTIVLTLLDIPRQKFKSSLFQSGTAISEEVVSGTFRLARSLSILLHDRAPCLFLG